MKSIGTEIVEPYAKPVQGKIWELRIKSIRIFYFLNEETFIFLHAIKKKTSKIPKKEIEIAKDRMKEYLERR